MKIVYKRVTMADYDTFNEIIEVDADAFQETSLTIWALESYVRFGFVYIACYENQIFGVEAFMHTGANDNKKEVYLVSMAVARKQHRKGIGKGLLGHAVMDLSSRNVNSICLHVDLKNISAIKLYMKSFDFKYIEYHSNEYGKGKDRAFLRLCINSTSEDGHYQNSESETAMQRERITNISKELRIAYYDSIPVAKDVYTKPLHGKISDDLMPTESLGPFPEFILPTFFCKHSIRGHCAPCFFSRHPHNTSSKETIFKSLIAQTKYIVDNFDDLVMKFQLREKNTVIPDVDVTFCYACNGSFFSNVETREEDRFEALTLLCDEVVSRGVRPLVYLETCADDFLDAVESGEIDRLSDVLHQLNAFFFFGLESVSEYSRNVLYNKGLSMDSFMKAISVCKEKEFGVGAFIFAGFLAMTENEIINDVTHTLLFLRANDVLPILMFPNLQPYTIYDLLYRQDNYNLCDPRTVLTIFVIMLEIFGGMSMDSDSWLTGDLFGGPPSPPTNVFSNIKKITCDKCAEIIRKAIMQMKKDADYARFQAEVKKIAKCDCAYKYLEQIERQQQIANIPLIDRVELAIESAEDSALSYMRC